MTTCRNCQRAIVDEDGTWIDPEAPVTGDDSIWRETCDASETFTAEHEPEEEAVRRRIKPQPTPVEDWARERGGYS